MFRSVPMLLGFLAMMSYRRVFIWICKRPLSFCLTAFQLMPFCNLTVAPLSEMHGKGRQKTAMAKNGLHGWRVWLHEGRIKGYSISSTSPEPVPRCMHGLGHLMTSAGEGEFVLVVLLLGQFVITAATAIGL